MASQFPDPAGQLWPTQELGYQQLEPRRPSPTRLTGTEVTGSRQRSESLLARFDGSIEPERGLAAVAVRFKPGEGPTLSASSQTTSLPSVFDLDTNPTVIPDASGTITLPSINEMLRPKSSAAAPAQLGDYGPLELDAPTGHRMDNEQPASKRSEVPEATKTFAEPATAESSPLSPPSPSPSPSPSPPEPVHVTPTTKQDRKRSTPPGQQRPVGPKRIKTSLESNTTPSRKASGTAKAKTRATTRLGQAPNLFGGFVSGVNVIDDEGRTVQLGASLSPPDIPYSEEEGSFIAYRRNNLTITASIDPIPSSVFVSSGKTRAKVDRLEAMLTSESAVSGAKIPLIQLDVTRKLKQAKDIEPAGFEPLAGFSSSRLEVGYARVQYRVSTTKSNHAHASEEEKLEKYQLVMAIVAVKADGNRLEVGRWTSEPLTVRGRSPKNFNVPAAIGKGQRVPTSKGGAKSRREADQKAEIGRKGSVNENECSAVGGVDGGVGNVEGGVGARPSEPATANDSVLKGAGGSGPYVSGIGGRTRSRVKVEKDDVWGL